jgi:hypothetical protein
MEWGPLSLVSTTEELLERKSSGSVLENEITAVGDPPRWLRDTPLSAKVGNNFADKRQSLGQYSSLADWGQGVYYIIYTERVRHRAPELNNIKENVV